MNEQNIDVEIFINVSKEEYDRRQSICIGCPHYTPSQNTTQEIVDATTGVKESVEVFKFEDCDIDNLSLIGYLSLKTSECPEGKW
jgi:hypothetical protein